MFFGFGIIGTQFFGETSENLGFDKNENVTEKVEIAIIDSIPQGKFKYEIYFAEFGGRLPNRTCDIEIKGNKIIVTQDETTNLTGGKIIFDGMILKHKSGNWILTNDNADVHADEIGGCTAIPIIDFVKKLIEYC